MAPATIGMAASAVTTRVRVATVAAGVAAMLERIRTRSSAGGPGSAGRCGSPRAFIVIVLPSGSGHGRADLLVGAVRALPDRVPRRPHDRRRLVHAQSFLLHEDE